jgi:hypothetical protein
MMKRSRIVAVGVLVLVLGIAGFWCSRLICPEGCRVFGGSHSESEISWMRAEFELDESEFKKVEQLHNEYVPRCDEYCRRVAETQLKVTKLAAASEEMTDELLAALRADERTRIECREALLAHLYETARSMPPEKGKRFLEIALPKVLAPDHPNIHRAVSH